MGLADNHALPWRDFGGVMKALSIRQPWAWLIISGHKDIENRTLATRYRGLVLIHAGKSFDKDAPFGRINGVELPTILDLQFGGIIGIAEITNCVSKSNSPWFTGPHGLVLRNANPLPFYACKGQLGFFEMPVRLNCC